jgi:hypothetical protein
MEVLKEIIHTVADLLTGGASAIAIYLFMTKRSEISAALRVLLNYSYQTTLSELKEKLERLNEYNANEPAGLIEIRNILHEIAGQVRGNAKLAKALPALAQRVETAANSKKLNEHAKRSLVAEMRETLRNLNVDSVEDMADI